MASSVLAVCCRLVGASQHARTFGHRALQLAPCGRSHQALGSRARLPARPRGAARAGARRRSAARTPGLRAASWTPAGWRRGRRCTRPRRTPRDRRRWCAREIGADTAGDVVRGGATGTGSVTGSTPCARQSARIVGKRRCEQSAPEVRASSQRWSDRLRGMPRDDRLGDDVARREVGERVHAGHERGAVASTQHRAFASKRLGEQAAAAGSDRRRARARWGGTARTRGRRTAAPAAQRQRDAVAGRDLGLVVTAKNWPTPPVASTTARPGPRRRRRGCPRRARAGSRRRRGRRRPSAGRGPARARSPRRRPPRRPRRAARARSPRRSRRRRRARPGR